MKNWYTKLGLSVLSLGLLTLSPMNASADACDPCDPCDPCGTCDFGDFTFGVDFLFMKPCVSGLDYAVIATGTEPATGSVGTFNHYKYKSICPEWDPGVHVYFSMPDFWCDWTLSASWHYLDSSDNSTAHAGSGTLYAVAAHPSMEFDAPETVINNIKGRWNMDYHEIDLLMSYDLCKKGCHTFSPFWGFDFLIIDQEFRTTVRTAEATVESQEFIATRWKDDFFGFGLKMGSNWDYRFSDCLSFYANAWGALLFGDPDPHADFVHSALPAGTPPAAVVTASRFDHHDDCCNFIHGYHIGVGLLYETCACDMEFGFKLGYEFTNWLNLPQNRTYTTNLDSTNVALNVLATPGSGRSIGMHGLVIGFQMGF